MLDRCYSPSGTNLLILHVARATHSSLIADEAASMLPERLLLWDVEQRTLVIGERGRVEDLDAGVVVAGKRRCGTRTACLHGIVRRIEPNPEVINLHGAIRDRARLGIGEDRGRGWENIRRGHSAKGNDECPDIEPPDNMGVSHLLHIAL